MNQKLTINIIGHTAADVLEDQDDLNKYQSGGGVYYSNLALQHIINKHKFDLSQTNQEISGQYFQPTATPENIDILISTVIKSDFVNLFNFKNSIILPSDTQTIFHNIYNNNSRSQKLYQVARPIELDEIQKADIFLLTPITNNEFNFNINQLNGVIALDIQGFIRDTDENQNIIPIFTKLPNLEKVHILKLNQNEFQEIFNKECNQINIQQVEIPILIITDHTNIRLKFYCQYYEFKHEMLQRPTGRGDILLSSFLYYLIIRYSGYNAMLAAIDIVRILCSGQ